MLILSDVVINKFKIIPMKDIITKVAIHLSMTWILSTLMLLVIKIIGGQADTLADSVPIIHQSEV